VPTVAGVLYGIKPAVTAIVVFAAYRIGSKALKNGVLWALAAAAFVAIFWFDAPFPYIVFGAAVLGVIGGRIAPEKFKTGGGHGASNKSYGPAIIDDHSPVPDHARFSWPRVMIFLAVGVASGVAVFALLLALYGWQGTLTQMGWFFTKAAFLTIGGAYAVLPYVYQGGVEQYGWLTGPQMIDGLALGETTPGPLIMVVTYVGFIGGWTKQVFGADLSGLSGIAGAMVATFFTFLPSFLFILIGGQVFRAALGHHGGGCRCGSQSGGVLRLARAVAAGHHGRAVFRAVSVVRRNRRHRRVHRAMALQDRHHESHRRLCAGRPDLPVALIA